MTCCRNLCLPLLLVAALGCGTTEHSNDGDTSGGKSDAANTTGNSASTTGSTASANSTTAATTNGSANTTATGMGDSSSDATTATATTDAGGSGGASSSNGGSGGASSSNGGDGGSSSASTTMGSGVGGAGGTGVIAGPGCGSHKWACWPMPNMVGSGLPNEASYTRNDGTVLDNVTGLMWEDRVSAQAHQWEDAIQFCEKFEWAGFDDWRLPTRIEITSVLDHSDAHTGWAAEAFEYPSSGFHHSASDWILTITQTGAGAGNDYAWAFNMSDGIVSNAYSKSNATAIKCVRGGGAGEGPSEPAVAPPDQYGVVAEGEVRDNYTGLVWQRGGSEDMLSWDEAVDYCDNLDLNGNDWRLPSIRELATLVDEAKVAPAINSEMFPDTKYGARSNNWYWATPERGSAAWGLNFDDGFTGTNTGSAEWNTFGPSWARCVR